MAKQPTRPPKGNPGKTAEALFSAMLPATLMGLPPQIRLSAREAKPPAFVPPKSKGRKR
jgi:hypothetical protein